MNIDHTTKEAKTLINEIAEEGFDKLQIIDAFCDGEWLSQKGITQEVAEEAVAILTA